MKLVILLIALAGFVARIARDRNLGTAEGRQAEAELQKKSGGALGCVGVAFLFLGPCIHFAESAQSGYIKRPAVITKVVSPVAGASQGQATTTYTKEDGNQVDGVLRFQSGDYKKGQKLDIEYLPSSPVEVRLARPSTEKSRPFLGIVVSLLGAAMIAYGFIANRGR